MTQQPSVSVIIPVYNTAPYLEQCLQSILGQSLRDLQIICVDNGSTDNSNDILAQFQNTYHNIEVLVHPDGKLGDARNAGLKVARGQYISFIDSDDFIHQNMLLDMYRKLEEYQADIAICNMTIYLQKENRYLIKDSKDLFSKNDSFTLLENIHLLKNLTSCNKIFRKSFLDSHHLRFPENSFHEDQYFVIKSLIHAEKLVTINEPYYYYRKQRDDAISSLNDKSIFHIFRIYDKVDQFLENLNNKEKYKDLIDQVRAQRYIIFSDQIKLRYLFSFCKKMRIELLTHFPQTNLLNKSERKRLYMITKYHHYVYSFYIIIRKYWGRVLRIKILRVMNTKFRQLS